MSHERRQNVIQQIPTRGQIRAVGSDRDEHHRSNSELTLPLEKRRMVKPVDYHGIGAGHSTVWTLLNSGIEHFVLRG